MFDFGDVVKKMKCRGGRFTRAGWNGKNMYIELQRPDEHSKMTSPYLYVDSRFGKVPWKETFPEMFDCRWEVVE